MIEPVRTRLFALFRGVPPNLVWTAGAPAGIGVSPVALRAASTKPARVPAVQTSIDARRHGWHKSTPPLHTSQVHAMQRRSFIFAGMLAAATSAGASVGDVPLPPPLDALSNLPLVTFQGAATTLGAHLRPGPAVISFWASWCAPCVAEAGYLSTIRRRYGADRLNMIGLNVELIDDDEAVQLFLAEARPNYTQLRADMSTYAAFGGDAAQLNLPRLFIFDASGRPRAAFAAMNVQAANRAIAGIVA